MPSPDEIDEQTQHTFRKLASLRAAIRHDDTQTNILVIEWMEEIEELLKTRL